MLGIYFYAPNGIGLEFACQPADGERPRVLACVTRTEAEAMAELDTSPGTDAAWIARAVAMLPD